MKMADAIDVLRVSRQTLYRWSKGPNAKIRTRRYGQNFVDYEDDDVYALAGRTKRSAALPDVCAVYARVGGAGPGAEASLAAQLDRVKAFAASRGKRVVSVYAECASAMSCSYTGRKAFAKCLSGMARGEWSELLVESMDRVGLLGAPFLEVLAGCYGVKVTFMSSGPHSDYVKEVASDILGVAKSAKAALGGTGNFFFGGSRGFFEGAYHSRRPDVPHAPKELTRPDESTENDLDRISPDSGS